MINAARRSLGRTAIRIVIRVRPGAPRTRVGGAHGDALVVHVTARPVGGAATAAALKAVARAFGVPNAAVTLVTGATSRDKVVEIAGDPEEMSQAAERLKGLFSPTSGDDGAITPEPREERRDGAQ